MAAAAKSIISLAVFFLLISFSLFISTGDPTSRRFSFSLPLPSPSSLRCPATSAATRPPPLKVYMYDLPRRFNLGMLDHRGDSDPEASQAAEGAAELPPWPQNSGIKKQHSVEYWMMASLMGGGKSEDAEAVRVFDGEEAEAFFVPFFSSLSFNTHGHNMTDPDTEIDRQLQIDLLDFLRTSKYWQRSAGRDHVIPMHHPNAFRFLRDQLHMCMLWIPFWMMILLIHMIPALHFSFFEGEQSGKMYEGKVRLKLAKILKGYDDVHFENSFATGEGIRASSEGMRSSKFCLHPAGDTPSSCRLFDAIVSHCVPVLVSDRIELPFEDEIDYSQFSLFFSVKEALRPDYMVNQLRQFPKERWTRMWRRLKSITHKYEFQHPTKRDDAVNMIWRQVRHKLPAANLAVHRSRRLKIPDWWSRR
ncbi:probable arabinosyltransferase ARAD1 isoform X2 [Elaeis guineensis]|uniref:probable arabinosyltransferase ARAD1 isoform X2 n=1 Tax=Elaeis guineensis var. tenera TaxID=51953 RepID=UPI003C6CF240